MNVVDDVRDGIGWLVEAIGRVARTKRGAYGAAWEVEDGPASALYTYGRIIAASRNHAAAEGAE